MGKTFSQLTVLFAIILSVSESSAGKLADLIPGLYGGDGITLATSAPFNHAAHFTIDSAASISRLNEQITSETGVFPFSSSAGGFTFAFDRELGTFVPTTETLGPLFAERAPTLGRGKLNLNASYTFFKYNKFNGEDLKSLQVVALHQPDVIPPPDVRTLFELDTILINFNIDIRTQIFAMAATYGITDRLDVGILVPIIRVDMDVSSHAEIIKDPSFVPVVHSFDVALDPQDDKTSDEAAGIGDIVLRAKYHLFKSDVVDISDSVLAKLKTGDERDFLGTGTTTVRPFLIFSRTLLDNYVAGLMFTPHINIGYEFNLDRNDQSSVEYSAGFDVGSDRFTVAGEVLGSHELGGDGIGDNIITGSLGGKWNPFKQFLLAVNVQTPLNEAGLRSNLVSTVGMEYSF